MVFCFDKRKVGENESFNSSEMACFIHWKKKKKTLFCCMHEESLYFPAKQPSISGVFNGFGPTLATILPLSHLP